MLYVKVLVFIFTFSLFFSFYLMSIFIFVICILFKEEMSIGVKSLTFGTSVIQGQLK